MRPRRAAAALAAVAGLLALAGAGLLIAGGDGEPAPPESASLAEYWAGSARWELAHKWTGASLGQTAPFDGARIEIVGDRWYLFNRTNLRDRCANGDPQVGLQVRESPDAGRSWGAPVPVVTPAPGTPWACAAADGDVIYDEGRGVWRYLFQCLDDDPSDGGWNGCYAERRGASPMGRFSAPGRPANPAIPGGSLWSVICDAGDDCARPAGQPPIRDEGTFDIFGFDGRDFWISFHGSDGVHGFRGIAKTPDFSAGSYVVDAPEAGLPDDAILDAGDATGFRETWASGGPVGAGAASIVAEGGFLYALAEFPDLSLKCTVGQNWDLGIFRSGTATSTTWEPLPQGNPIVWSSREAEQDGTAQWCNVLYPSLFRDPQSGSWYLMHGRGTPDPEYAAIYVYRLVRDESLLVNEDFARGDAQGWATPPGSALGLSVPRRPNRSPDGTPYLALGCGVAPCPPDQSAYQDVAVTPELRGRRFSFGGSFRAESGSGAVQVAVRQLDARGAVVRQDVTGVDVGARYATARGSGTVEDDAVTLRYVLFPKGSQHFGADSLFLTPES
jgi:hypothetical protein